MSKRVKKLQRRFGKGTPDRVYEHNNQLSTTHEKDKKAAARFRNRRAERWKIWEREPRAVEEFPLRSILTSNNKIVEDKKKGLGFEEVKPKEWAKFERELVLAHSFYYRKGKEKKDKKSNYLQKQNCKGVLAAYMSLPKWWSHAIAESVEKDSSSDNVDFVREQLQKLGEQLCWCYASRSGYAPLAFNVHLESKDNIHIEVKLGTVDSQTHQLLGKKEGRGRRGLRNPLGDSLLNIWRYDRVSPVSEEVAGLARNLFRKANIVWDLPAGSWKKPEYDDVAAASLIEGKLPELFPALKDKASELALVARGSYNVKAEELTHSRRYITNIVKQNRELQETVKSLTNKMSEAIISSAAADRRVSDLEKIAGGLSLEQFGQLYETVKVMHEVEVSSAELFSENQKVREAALEREKRAKTANKRVDSFVKANPKKGKRLVEAIRLALEMEP